ncbi:hypothetical protein B0H13DRAFT_1877509 [Mycena leptocephala]|nr:hypothetical protein B0H13DRAFT_1877509 [Mycena leptocephala]
MRTVQTKGTSSTGDLLGMNDSKFNSTVEEVDEDFEEQACIQYVADNPSLSLTTTSEFEVPLLDSCCLTATLRILDAMDSLSSLAVGEPKLLPELEHRIFEIAALACMTEIPNLLWVVQRVKQWLEPLLYCVVLCTSVHPRPIHGFPYITTDILLEGNQAALVANSVKHLFLADHTRTDTILIACPWVTSLSMCLDRYTDSELNALLELESLQRLTINYNAAFVSSLINLFCNVTIPTILDFDHLCCIVLRYYSMHTSMDARPLVDDHRFVHILLETYVQQEVDWLRDVLGTSKDYWVRAETFITDRHRLPS